MALTWVLIFVIQALLTSALGKATGSSTNVGIFGGNKIEIKDAPYMAALFHDDNFVCGGSIVDDFFILTAAYCCLSSAVNKVYVGSSDVKLNGTTINVTHTEIHPDYNNKTFNNNICLLKLQDSVPYLCSVAKLNLEQSVIIEGSLVKVTGWGLPEEHGNYPGVLRQAEIPVVSEEKCLTLFPNKTENSFCAGSPGIDYCHGDVGGPLVFNDVQVGIASSAKGHCGQNPSLYTKVSSFKTWIHETIQRL